MVVLVEPGQVRLVWNDVWSKIHSAVDLETEAELLADLESGNRILLLAGEGAAVVRSCGSFLEINYVGGSNVHAWKNDLDHAITLIANDLGLKRIVALGRKGWSRIWPEYRDTQKLLFIKEL